MPHRLAAARKAAYGAIGPSHNHVWISDDLLQESLHAFTSAARTPGCRRHGSNVPGPLEARRRLAKRQLGHLAIGQYGAPPLDAALTLPWFGDRRGIFQEPELRWQPPGATQSVNHSRHKYPDLPAWLDVKRPPSCTKQEDLVVAVPEPSRSVEPISTKDYRARLKRLHDLSSLRGLHEELGSAALDTKECSRLAFEHFLGRYRRTGDLRDTERATLLEFLGDDKLESSDGLNLERFLRVLLPEGTVSNTEYLFLRKQVMEYISAKTDVVHLNVLETKCRIARAFLGLTAHVSTPGCGKSSLLDLCNDLWRVENGLRGDKKLCRMLFQYILDHPLTENTVQFATDVLLTSKKTFLYSMDDLQAQLVAESEESRRPPGFWASRIGMLIKRIIQHDIIRQAEPVQSSTRALKENSAPGQDTSLLTFFLHKIPKERVRQITTAMHWCMIKELQGEGESTEYLARFRIWFETLQSIHVSWAAGMSDETKDLALGRFAAAARPAQVPFVFRPMKGSEIGRALYQHWVPRIAALPWTKSLGNKPLHEEAVPQILERVKDHWRASYVRLARRNNILSPRQRLDKHAISLASLAHAVKIAGLDSEVFVLDVFDLLKTLDRQKGIVAMARGMRLITRGSEFTIKQRSFLSDIVNELSTTDVHSALRVFNLDTRLFLSQHPNVIFHALKDSKIHPRRILRLLREPDPFAELVPGLRTQNPQCKLTPDRVNMVHRLALNIANSSPERFSDRVKMNCIFGCWKYLKNHKAPIGRAFSEALVKIGVIQSVFRKEWIPDERFQWILRVVREVEGEEAADELDRMVWEKRPEYGARMVTEDDPETKRQKAGGGQVALPTRAPWQKGFIGPLPKVADAAIKKGKAEAREIIYSPPLNSSSRRRRRGGSEGGEGTVHLYPLGQA